MGIPSKPTPMRTFTATSDSPTDSELLRQMHAGGAAAFDALYRRHQGPLYRFCLMRSGSSDIAADVVQETFIGLLTGAFTFDPLRGSLANFLFGVARNLVMKQDRPLALHDFDADNDDGEGDQEACGAPTPLQRLLLNEQAEQVRQALALLPPHYRDVLILYELHERSYLDIAAICQLDIGTVRSRLSRGRAALAKRLAGWRQPLDVA
jgi:RNA polymerase sigma-70 factor (ECF subfamily)